MKTTIYSDILAAKNVPHFGLEFFVPDTESAMEALIVRIDRMTAYQPVFVSVTGGSTLEDLTLFVKKLLILHIKILVRIDCTDILRSALKDVLGVLKEHDVKDVLVFHDNSWRSGQHGGLSSDLDVVKFIKHTYRHHFCICTACVPEYASSIDGKYQQIETMKALIQAGVSYFVSEIIFDCQCYFDFVNLCSRYGITCPIIPTIMPIQSYKSFKKISEAFDIHIPSVSSFATIPTKHLPFHRVSVLVSRNGGTMKLSCVRMDCVRVLT